MNDDPQHHYYIRTIPGRDYAFAAPVREVTREELASPSSERPAPRNSDEAALPTSDAAPDLPHAVAPRAHARVLTIGVMVALSIVAARSSVRRAGRSAQQSDRVRRMGRLRWRRGNTSTVHVRRSTDGGANWSADMLTVNGALSPQLAVNSQRQVTCLYQQLTGAGASQRCQTMLAVTGIAPSSSSEFEPAQTLNFSFSVAPGDSIEVPTGFHPSSAGAKSANITFSTNDPTAPSKVSRSQAPRHRRSPAIHRCSRPSTRPSVRRGAGQTGDYTVNASGRVTAAFGASHTLGVQTSGEYMDFPGRQEGQLDVGLLYQRSMFQFGLSSSFKGKPGP